MPDGASRRSVVSLRLRISHLVKTSTFLLWILPPFLAAFLAAGCRPNFERQGLPTDFSDYLGQLRSLKVPASVDCLDWLPENLEELDASNTKISTLQYLPPRLQRLDLSKANSLTHLPELPPSLKELDIRYTHLEGPWRLSQHLESLHLGGTHVKTLEGLGESLFEVTIENARIESTAGLPRSLQSLSISGAALGDSGEPLLKNLDKLPSRLKELRLTNTGIETLKALPSTLQSLTLINNAAMEVELPRFLVNFTIGGEHRRMSPLEDLKFLNQLDIQGAAALREPPLFLRDLRVPVPGRWTPQLTQSLKRLWFTGDKVGALPALPQGLEDLRWPGATSVEVLPRSLKRLDIRSTPPTGLAGLPPNVTSLDVSNTNIPIGELPKTLQSLTYRLCPFNVVTELPPSLRNLDLSGSTKLTTLDLGELSLARLNISGTEINQIPILPRTLMDLDISNTPIGKLQHLPEGLRSLTVHEGQLRSLAGLPDSVTNLYFLEHH